MSKSLIVGDLHAMPSNLEDTERLFGLIEEIAIAQKPSKIIFLGDLFHTHAVVRQEVGHFVRSKILRLQELAQVVILAGNHDGASPHSVEKNAVRLLFDGYPNKNIVIVDGENGVVLDEFFFVPFIGENEKFVQSCQTNPDKILVCHQTVKGAYYENNSLAPDGVDQDLLPQKKVIAGHIHMCQHVGKTLYPGTPRALNANECNQEKRIYVFDSQADTWLGISTTSLVKCFYRYDIKEDQPDLVITEEDRKRWKVGDDIRIYITGSEVFYKEMLEKCNDLAGIVRFVPNIRKNLTKKINVEASDGDLKKLFKFYVQEIFDTSDESKGKIWTKLQELIPNL